MSLNGLYGHTHYELEEFVDLSDFDKIQLDIWKGIAIAKPKVRQGILPTQETVVNRDYMSFNPDFVMLDDAYKQYKRLPKDDPIKITGEQIFKEHGYNALVVFLKFAYGAHDAMTMYQLWDQRPGWRTNPNHRSLTNIAEDFPALIEWIDKLVGDVFSNIGRAYLLTLESNGYSFEHRDPSLDPDVIDDGVVFPEFIHVRPNLNRPFYVYDYEEKVKHHVESRVGWWNDRDVHGGSPIMEPSYAIRIDGIFTDSFRKKIGIA